MAVTPSAPLLGTPEPPRAGRSSRALWVLATTCLALSVRLSDITGPRKAAALATFSKPAVKSTHNTTVIQVFVVKASETPADNAENAYDVLHYLVGPLLPAGYHFSYTTYSSLNALLDAAEADDTLLSAGSVVLYPSIRSEIDTRNFTGTANTTTGSRSVDRFCAYQWSNADALLLSGAVRRLLKWPKPLVLVDASDWACRASYPPTIHQVWRNSYGGAGVDANTRFIPLGSEYGNMAGFERNASLARDSPVAERRWAVAWIGTLMYRKPERVHFHRLMSSGMKGELEQLANASGLDGIVYDMTRDGTNSTNYTFSADWGGATYTDVLAHSRLYACLAGDVWADTNIWNALEYGTIPVVERRANYKGCVDPTGWLRRSGAPVLWVDDWSELPKVVAEALSDDAALEARRRELVRWWAAAKSEIGSAIASFHAEWADADAYPENDCASVALARADEAAYQTELNEFYSEANWFDNYGDTPWAEAVFCFKQSTDYWAGLQCYSPRCAEPTVASFTCGNVTLSAKSF